MARKRNAKQTEKPTVTLKELPRETEELTGEEAEATKGGFWSLGLYASRLAAGNTPETSEQTAQIDDDLVDPALFKK